MPKNTSAGTIHASRSRKSVLSCTRVYFTSKRERRSASSGGTRFATTTVLAPSGFLSFPVMCWSETVTSAMRPSSRYFSNSLYGTTSMVCARRQPSWTASMSNTANRM